MDVMVTWATWEILARASPLKPYVAMDSRSSNFFNLDVVNRSHTSTMSSFCRGGGLRDGEGVTTATLPSWSEAVYHQKLPTYPDPAPVVLNLEQLQTPLLANHGDPGPGTGTGEGPRY